MLSQEKKVGIYLNKNPRTPFREGEFYKYLFLPLVFIIMINKIIDNYFYIFCPDCDCFIDDWIVINGQVHCPIHILEDEPLGYESDIPIEYKR